MRHGTLIIQPWPGIGDMIWHLPHIRAVARREGPVTLLTKSRSLAAEWLASDPLIHEVLYADRRGLSLSLFPLLSRHFAKAWILHRSLSYALLPYFARIPERIGFGYGTQKLFLTNKTILPEHMKSTHTFDQINELLKREGLAVRTEDQRPPIDMNALKNVRERLSPFPRPWVIFGIGASEPSKRWPFESFAELAQLMLDQSGGTFFVCGSGHEEKDAKAVLEALPDAVENVHPLTDLSIREAFALLSDADLYIGNDTSLLNIAASYDTPAVGLFGATPPLSYVPSLFAVEPPLGKASRGMRSIVPQQVLSFLNQMQLWPKNLNKHSARSI